jgi:hypothetical protein
LNKQFKQKRKIDMIKVITHNGKPPSQGGLRIGYQVEDVFFHIATQRAYSVSAILEAQRPVATAAPKARQLLKYFDLPFCNKWGDCDYCSKQNNQAQMEETDIGSMKVVTCWNCGRKMRH